PPDLSAVPKVVRTGRGKDARPGGDRTSRRHAGFSRGRARGLLGSALSMQRVLQNPKDDSDRDLGDPRCSAAPRPSPREARRPDLTKPRTRMFARLVRGRGAPDRAEPPTSNPSSPRGG